MKILFSAFTIFCLFLFSSCSDKGGTTDTGLGGIGGGGGGGTGGVTFTITHGQGNQGIVFYASPSKAIVVTKVTAALPAQQFEDVYQGDGTTVFAANTPHAIGEYTGVQSGQKWVFTIEGKIESATGTAFNVATNFTVP